MISKILLIKKREIKRGRRGKRRRTCLFLKYGEGFHCKYSGESRQSEEPRLNMVSRLNPTLRGGVRAREEMQTKRVSLGQ